MLTNYKVYITFRKIKKNAKNMRKPTETCFLQSLKEKGIILDACSSSNSSRERLELSIIKEDLLKQSQPGRLTQNIVTSESFLFFSMQYQSLSILTLMDLYPWNKDFLQCLRCSILSSFKCA